MAYSITDSPEVLEAINTAPLFATVAPAARAEMARAARLISLSPGQALFPEGAGADALYIVNVGKLHAVEPDPPGPPRLVRILGPGQVVDGVIELVGDRRPVSVLAAEESVVTLIPGDVIDRLDAADPEFRAARDRLHRRQLLTGLHHIFGPIDGELMAAIEAEAEWHKLQRGQVLWEPDSPSDRLFFIVTGRVSIISVLPNGSEQLEYHMGRGQVLGSLGFLDGRPRRFRARALRDTLVVGFSAESFDRLIARQPQVVRKITAGAVERTEGRERLMPQLAVSTIAVLRASEHVDMSRFVERLESALARFGAVLRLTKARVDQMLTEPGIADSDEDSPDSQQLLAWLDASETRHRFVILEVEPEWENWTRRCIRRADRLLLVGAAADSPRRGDRERAATRFSGPDSRTSLVLIHPDGSRTPSGTRAWLNERPEVTDHFHVRWDRSADLDRLARVLAGRSIGLALGGGGARGFAHIGLLRAIAEHGIPVDAIGGTSMGGSIAAQYAMGRDYQTIATMARKIFLEIKPHRSFTVPFYSFVSAKRLEMAGRVAFGDMEIEDLWLPFFCVSSNLTNAQVMVHKQGTLWKATQASASLPGFGVPVLYQKHLLVDGGLLNNLPTDIMRRMGYGTVIASVVSVDRTGAFTAERVPTPWEAFLAKLGRGHREVRFPSLFEVVVRASLLHGAHVERANARHADVTVHPALGDFGLLEFERMDEIVEMGYQRAHTTLGRWRDFAGELFD
jgi:NTE family protein/lysophospholipid hydrolase